LIKLEEHIYFDDPLVGHPDVRTRLKDAEYFFFGNGLIQGAVQYSPSGEGSPFGLLMMVPEELNMKRNALTMNKSSGLSDTAILISEKDNTGVFADNGIIRWKQEAVLPQIEVLWNFRDIKITELIYCPDRKSPSVIREVILENCAEKRREIQISTSVPGKELQYKIILNNREQKNIYINYTLLMGKSIGLTLLNKTELSGSRSFWKNKAKIKSDYSLIERVFSASAFQLPSMISANGKMDASIWQYNREWVRDHSFMCLGLIYTGHFDLAREFLERLLCKFVSDEGDTIDSSENRSYDEVELDQNGELLYTINEYFKWTGDNGFIIKHSEKIILVAEFPLKSEFMDMESGLLHNKREYWERHSLHGITDGFEFAYQMWVIKGLKAAASMVRECGFGSPDKWEDEAIRLYNNLFDERKSGLISEGSLIKRRDRNGNISLTIDPKPGNGLNTSLPLMKEGDHFLNPDASVSQAIVYDIIDPKSDLALKTMDQIEELWNQAWKGGGYGRYNLSSEPDSPGPWPFPSLFIARAYQKMGNYDKVERVLNWLDKIPGSNSGSWFENYGERISPPYPQVGIPPWTWAEMIMLVIKDILGVEPERNHIRIKPVLLPSMDYIEATISIREMIIDLKIMRTNKEKKTEEVRIPIIKERVSVSVEI
jgi:hypothetical protein